MNSAISANALARGLAAAVLLAATAPAFAGELNDSPLRGAFADNSVKGYGRWDGYYFGALAGFGSSTANFGTGTSNEIAYILRNTTLENEAQVSTWTTLPESTHNFRTWGVFGGVSRQFDRLVVSGEVTYNRTYGGAVNSSSDSIHRSYQTSDGYLYDVHVDATGTMSLNEYGTVRGRVGYVMGQFLPYVALGAAVASINYSTSATVSNTATDVSGQGRPDLALPSTTRTDARNNAAAYGGVVALGLDVTVLPNVFLRGEWEYVAYSAAGGIRFSTNAFRGGLGLKF